MESQNSREPALRLPRPVPEQAAWQQTMPTNQEHLPAGEFTPLPLQPVPMIGGIQQAGAVPQLSATPAPTMSQAQQQAVASTSTKEEEINRILVDKAKHIVDQTHTDPFRESEELGKLKFDHLRDAHGKDIKVAEGRS